MGIVISKDVEEKIGSESHGNICVKEVHECFANHCGGYAYEHHPEHKNDKGKATPWFVADTNHGRTLKVMFVRRGNDVHVKSVYPATENVQRIYDKFAE